jgi:hypothetical protein
VAEAEAEADDMTTEEPEAAEVTVMLVFLAGGWDNSLEAETEALLLADMEALAEETLAEEALIEEALAEEALAEETLTDEALADADMLDMEALEDMETGVKSQK